MSPDLPVDETVNQGEVRSEWVPAPADSHVGWFQLVDRSASAFGASSEILVTFKSPKASHSPPAMYRYKFSKHNAARSVFEQLKGSDHPGQVIHAELIKKNVPYTRLN